MAQTIPTPGSDAIVASQPTPTDFPGLADVFGMSDESITPTEGFSGLEDLKLSEPMTDEIGRAHV